jgi:hypothetical protein
MTSIKDMKRTAWLTGQFWEDNPDVTLDDAVNKLDKNHPICQAAWKRWREHDINFDDLMFNNHGRVAVADDTFGPATAELAAKKRCMVPDVTPPKELSLVGLSMTEKALIENYRTAAQVRKEFEESIDAGPEQAPTKVNPNMSASGSGSWPTGCAGDDYPSDEHTIRVNLDTSGAAQHWKDSLPSVIANTQKAYAAIGLRVVYELNLSDPRRNSEIHKQFERIPGGVIGWNEFPSPGT